MTEPAETERSSNLAPSSRLRLPLRGKAGHIQDSPPTSDVAGPSLLIIACGNDLRQDDGAGLALAQQMAQAAPPSVGEVECVCVHQLTPDLAVQVAQPSVVTVFFVDTRVLQANGADSVRAPEIRMTPLGAEQGDPHLGHHVDASMVLLYARELYAAQVAAWAITIPGWAFDHGEGFSPQVQALLAGADGFIAQAYRHLVAAGS